MAKLFIQKKLVVIVGVAALVVAFAFGYPSLVKPNEESFKAPGRNWISPKKVEDYFVERLRMSPQEASEIRSKPGVDGTVDLRINNNATLEGLVGNLYYYGFVKDEDSLHYALEHTKDTTPSDKAIKVGKDGTIDINAEYRISENMSAWELADVLLNKPTGHFPFDEYNYFFMP